MDKGTRRAQKARIRARLRRRLEQQIRDAQQAEVARCGRAITAEYIKDLQREIYRNEGKPSVPWINFFEYGLSCRCDCGYCVDNRRYRTLREAERMVQDERQWRLFGRGEGEEDATN